MLRLAPGDYTVRADVPSVPAGGSEPVAVHVERGRTVSITLPVDSGIR
jgi:hypothetical protein